MDKYKTWENSKEKTSVVVALQSTSSAGSQKIGFCDLDLDCPLDITRELLRRALWRELNELTGAGFDFIQRGNIVQDKDEPQTKLRDVAPQRLDAATRELENTLTIAGSTSREQLQLEPQCPVYGPIPFLINTSVLVIGGCEL